jgi:hypothetical protein
MQADENRASLVTSEVASGSLEIAAVLDTVGECATFGPGSWTYLAGLAQAIKHPGVDQVSIVIPLRNGPVVEGIASGLVVLDRGLVFWFDPRDLSDKWAVNDSAGAKTIHGPTQTLADGVREWGTPRGQLLVKLAQKAQALCDTMPVAPAP